MKNVKFSLSSIEGKLSRVEMQQILGGCGGGRYTNCDYSIPYDSCPNGRKVFRSEAKRENYICCLKPGEVFPQ